MVDTRAPAGHGQAPQGGDGRCASRPRRDDRGLRRRPHALRRGARGHAGPGARRRLQGRQGPGEAPQRHARRPAVPRALPPGAARQCDRRQHACPGSTGGSRAARAPRRAAPWGSVPATAPPPTWRAHASGPPRRASSSPPARTRSRSATGCARRRPSGCAAPDLHGVRREYVKRREGEWKNPVHRKQWRDTLGIGGVGKSRMTYCDSLHGLRVNKIDGHAIRAVLDPIWAAKPETASRLRGRLERILDAAKCPAGRRRPGPAAAPPGGPTTCRSRSRPRGRGSCCRRSGR